MKAAASTSVVLRIAGISVLLSALLLFALLLALAFGSTDAVIEALSAAFKGEKAADPMVETIVWQIRFPRVLLAVLVGAALSLGGLVFQALLRNPLAEPYILGVSGGSAVGAIIGILMGLSRFPGVGLSAFAGSMATLALVLVLSSGQSVLKKDSLLLAGVMVNAFCSAVITFLISLTQDARLHNIIYWLMGDLGQSDLHQVGLLAAMLIPCFVLFFVLSHPMNLLLMGKETAQTMGVNTRAVTLVLLVEVVCVDEKEVIAVESIADELIKRMGSHGARVLTERELHKVTNPKRTAVKSCQSSPTPT